MLLLVSCPDRINSPVVHKLDLLAVHRMQLSELGLLKLNRSGPLFNQDLLVLLNLRYLSLQIFLHLLNKLCALLPSFV